MIDLYSSVEEFEAQKPNLAVLGIGAIEQHGPHLPVGTDWMIARALSQAVAEALDAWLLPTIPVSLSECHGPLAGTVWLKPATLGKVLHDLSTSIYRCGIRKLLVLNAHGGNFILQSAIDAIVDRLPDLAIHLHEATFLDEPAGTIFETGGTDLHAGEIETSLMLFLYPSLVDEERVDHIPPAGREFLDYLTIDRLCQQGVWGHATKGEAEKGRRAFEAEVQKIIQTARHIFGEIS